MLWVLYLVGLCSLFLWPDSWHGGLLAGWLSAGFAAMLLKFRRRQALRSDARQMDFFVVLTLSFLGRLVLLVLGALAGKFFGLFHIPSFLGAFLVAYVLGEILTIPGLARASRQMGSDQR